MRKITLYRPEENCNKNCSYQILVNNHFVTTLKNGEEKIIEVPSQIENSALTAKIQWCGSEKVKLLKVSNNEKIIISGNQFLNKRLPLLGGMFPIIGLIFFNLNLVPKYVGIGVFIVFLIGITGTITIWRHKWLEVNVE